jgi:transcriptional regulator with XRE-family HTH domain
MNSRELGHLVSDRRKELHMSQAELAQRARLSRNYISLIERGLARNASTKVLNQLAVALGVKVGKLFGQPEVETALIPPTLREFALEKGLSYDVVDRMSRIPLRGREPRTVEEWEALYAAVHEYLDG